MTHLYKLSTALIGCYFGIFTILLAQTPIPPDAPRTCLTTEIHQTRMQNDPVYQKHFLEKQDRARMALTKSMNSDRSVACGNPVILPMAVHFQNISNPDVTCLRDLAAIQIQILNDDYQGLNTDIINWTNGAAAYFPGVDNGETCIEFCLATQYHPAGYGIVDGDPAVTINQFTGDFNADWSGYINIFVRNIGALGYSPLGGDGDGDGVTIDVAAFGSGPGCPGVVPGSPYDLGRTLTHELGHYMNLDHIWGGGCGSDDGIGDTPDSANPWYGCPALGVQTCSTNDMHMNYMDYTNDLCMYMFSAGQSTEMENYTSTDLGGVSANDTVCLPPSPRIQFVTDVTDVLEGTSNCFTAGTKDIIVTLSIAIAPDANAVVSFNLAGSSTIGEDYDIFPPSVTFPAGQSADQEVTVTIYEDAEVESDEDIELTYTINANGGDAVAGPSNQMHTVNVDNDDFAPSTSVPVTLIDQNFNGGLGGWTINDGGSTTDTWELSSSNGGLDGSQYIIADSDAAGNGTSMNEEILSPVFDGSSVTGLTLDFDQYINIYAGNGDFNETFDIDLWDGSSWQNVFHWQESDGDIGSWGSPDHQSIDISAHADANNQLRFTYIAEWDWWWALDNIEVTGTGQLDVQTTENTILGFVEYEFGPNKTIHFYDEDSGNIMLTLVNNSSHDYGCTHVEVDRGAGNPPGATLCSAEEVEYVTDKTFKIDPEFNNPSGDYTISLYYTNEEISGWETESGANALDLEMVKSPVAIDGAVNAELSPVTVSPFGTDFIYTATFSSGFSGLALGNALSPLPVELVDLNADPLDHSILLAWTTASETNNKGFELLRSTTPQNGFKRIAWVDGKGTTSTMNIYRYEDKNAVPGLIYYYQLKQIDFDESFSFSKIVSASLKQQDTQFDILPNPVKDIMTVNIDSPVPGALSVVHVSGQVVKTQQFMAGAQQMAIDMKGYARGVYWIVMQTENERIVERVVKMDE